MAPTEVGYVGQLADIGDEVVRVFGQRSGENIASTMLSFDSTV
jgi:hypothetical protein